LEIERPEMEGDELAIRNREHDRDRGGKKKENEKRESHGAPPGQTLALAI
jgi:hypothetical protein